MLSLRTLFTSQTFQGDDFWEVEKWGDASNKYRNAALLAGPGSVHLYDLCEALWKLQRCVVSFWTSVM